MPSPRRLNPLVLLALIAPAAAAATHPSWRIESVAGNGRQGFGGDGGPAKSATLDNPFGVIRGPDGALWFCEYTGQRIRRIARDGTISTLAGTGAKGYSGDGGLALQATFNLPHEIRFDARGNLFVVDMANHAIRRMTWLPMSQTKRFPARSNWMLCGCRKRAAMAGPPSPA